MVNETRFCRKCGCELADDEKHKLCPVCRKNRRKKWCIVGSVVFIGSAIGIGYLLRREGYEKGKDSDYGEDDINDIPSISDSDKAKIIQAPGEKYWNSEKQNWEKGGKPYLYRVTYTDTRDGSKHVNDYSDIDNGYEDYEYLSKRWWTSNVTWNHIAPEEQGGVSKEYV